ncbi:MAG TPA: chemotaxis protein CheA [Candidatus Aquilonibacter sp.]|jgi:two-component system chemotaxis sensor kinase CheA|nr:chemotaxis protein CheA [Candidatus Aquilonibacter sp.]
MADFDREAVLASFLSESEEGLDAMEQALIQMESNPSDPELLHSIFRVAHSLKGNATSLEFNELAGFAHVVEDLLDVFREQQTVPGAELITLLLKAVDELRAMLAATSSGQTELTAGQQKIRKEIAREVEKRSKRVVTTGGLPGESSAAAKGDTLPNTAHRTLRADVSKLDHMLDLTGEIVIAQGRLRRMIEQLDSEQGRAILDMHREAERLYMDLQSEVMSIRMVQIGPVFRQFVRSVRDLARSHGKLARLEVVGEDVEVDTTVLELLKDPLLHLVRNAVDHGLEKPSVRESQGKNPCGLIRLTAAHSGGNIVVKLEDDGAGFDRARILEKAKRLGILTGKEELRDQEIYDLVFQAGFSTTDSVTDLSGRGVGLDVVRRNIDILRGTVEVASTEGKGSTTTIRLPLTLAIIEGFSVKVGVETFIVPLEHVTECTELPAEQRSGEASGILHLRGNPLPYVRLRQVLGLSGKAPKRENILVVKLGEFHAGIAVDELLGGMQTVVKPLGRTFRAVHGIAGSTVLGDGRVGLIIDVPSLLRGMMQSPVQAQA